MARFIGSSPHTRGARTGWWSSVSTRRIIPAYAGSTRGPSGVGRAVLDHPRIRGEHTPRRSAWPTQKGSSPHTRGALPETRRQQWRARIIPAYAGSTSKTTQSSSPPPDHPRIRGEHGIDVLGRRVAKGSSPHTRGARPVRSRPGGQAWIIPAYAGSTSILESVPALDPDHPRIRGEHAWLASAAMPALGSSPHTRGAPAKGVLGGGCRGIIPAYAGSTSEGLWWLRSVPDHPRIRGEHAPGARARRERQGSSPHTRGARVGDGAPLSGDGIIPAYAGSTLGNPCNTKDRRRDYTSFPLPVTHPSGGGGS